tara:strand:- start:1609 stop:3087 length:1479 start_codon:yes stop_codon:yes gene_type:complete
MKSIFIEKSLGMDIREDSIALTLMGKKLRIAEVLAGDFFKLKPLTGQDEKAEKEFLNKVNQFLIANNTWPESVVVSLPRNLVMFKTFELPAPDEKTVRSMIDFELERHFPSGLENLYYTFQINQKPDNIFHIVSGAIKKEIADYYLELINKLNLKPTALNISTFANTSLTASINSNEPGVSALADISSKSLDIVLIKNGIIELSRSLSWKFFEQNNAFFEKENLSENIETLSKSISIIIVKELEQSLSSCSKIEDNEAIEQISIIGGGPFNQSYADHIEKESEVSTILLGVPESVAPSLPESFSKNHMITAMGLALSGFKNQNLQTNLLPEKFRQQTKKSNPKTSLVLATIALLFLGGWIGNQIHYNKKTLTSLEGQLKEIKEEVLNLEKIDLEYISIQQYVDILNKIDRQYPAKLPILNNLSQSLPKDSWLTNIKIKKGELEIKGFSPAASKLVPLIEKSPRFKKARFAGAITRESTGEKFTIRAKLEPKL